MNYNWQHPQWPSFTYNDGQSSAQQYEYALLAGKLSGGMSQLNHGLHEEAYLDLMVSEAINTSEIEGERLNREDVRSSIKNFLGLNPQIVRVADARAQGVAALMVDVRKSIDLPLTKQKLWQWQSMVMLANKDSLLRKSIEVGQWRSSSEPMQIVSGPIGYEKVHYQAPPANDVDGHMSAFIDWFNQPSDIKGPVKAAIAHLWFESIHPFEDGNGRVGRAIAELALAQDLGYPLLMSLSTEIEKNRNDYYQQLNCASGYSVDITDWVNWFCRLVLSAQKDATGKVEFILKKAQFWQAVNESAINPRQNKVLNKLFAAGPDGFEFGISAKKYQSITSCSKATATRDLAALVELGGLYRLEGGGRNARYGLSL